MFLSHCSLPKLTLSLVAVIFVIGGCQRQNENILSAEEASQLLDRYMETINNVDMDLIDEIISPDYVLRSPMFPEPIVGIEGYKAMVTNTAVIFPDIHAEVNDIVIRGDELWGRFTLSGTNTGPIGELPPTGKTFQISGLAITTVAGGMIISDETQWNVLDMFQQLGFTLVPPQTEQ